MFCKKENMLFLSVSFIVVLISSLLYNQGIILNDELQLRLYRLNGFTDMLSWILSCELGQGRPLRIMSVCDISIGMLFKDYAKSRLIQIGIVWFTLLAYGYFVYLLFRNKYLAILTMVFWLAYLPINFEHSVPNAFVGLTLIPILLLMVSLVFFIKYLNNNSRLFLNISIAAWGLCLLGYEYMVCFCLLYPLVVIKYCNLDMKNKWLFCVKKSFVYLIIGLVYVCGLLSIQLILPVKYSGLQIDLSDPWKCAMVSFNLIRAVIPGFYLEHNAFLYDIYSYHIKPFEIVKMCKYHFTVFDVIFFICLITLLWQIEKKIENNYNLMEMKFKYVLVMIMYLIIPTLPNCITKLYHDYSFIALPVSYSLSLVMALLISSFWLCIITKVRRKTINVILVIVVSLYSTLVFNMNQVISAEQKSNFERFQLIEKMIKSPIFTIIKDEPIFAPDIIQTKNLLAVHDSYWDSYSKNSNIDVRFYYEHYNGNGCQIWENDCSFTLIKGKYGIVYSEKIMNQNSLIRISEDSAMVFSNINPITNDGIFLYPFKINSENKIESVDLREVFASF